MALLNTRPELRFRGKSAVDGKAFFDDLQTGRSIDV